MKKLVLIGLILIIALSSLGFVAGAWNQSLNVNNFVDSGIYDVVFNSFTPPTASYGADFSVYQADTHSCEISLIALYPGLDGTFNFTLKNTGTIPAKITDIKIDGISGLSADIDLDGVSHEDITVTVSGISNTTTLDAGSSVAGTLTVHTWILSSDSFDATANAGGTFTFEIDTAQGN